MTVEQLIAQCDALRGKQVRVAGYIPGCRGYDCALYVDKAAMEKAVGEFRSEMQRRRNGELVNPTEIALPATIGIGRTEAFDRKAANFRNSYVVISGRVDDHSCTGAGGTDRAYGVEPTDIRVWTPAEGAPANT